MHATELFALSMFAWVSSFTPGPNVAIATTTGVNFGLRAAVPHIVGVTIGFVFMMWVVGLSGAALLQHSPYVIMLIRFASNAYLLYLAYRLCGSASINTMQGFKPFRFRQSLFFQFVNPKAWMMLAAAIPTYALGHSDFYTRMWWISFGFALPCVISLLCWAWVGEKMRSWLLHGQRLRRFNFCMGLSLALTAAWMIIQ